MPTSKGREGGEVGEGGEERVRKKEKGGKEEGGESVPLALILRFYHCKLRTQYVDGIYSNSMTLTSRLEVTQGHWKWHHSIDGIRVFISVPQ